jgi:hypothetical protein
VLAFDTHVHTLDVHARLMHTSMLVQWKASSGLYCFFNSFCPCETDIVDLVPRSYMMSMAYFYFDFRDVDKQKLGNLLPSLLIQLSARSDHCCDILSR